MYFVLVVLVGPGGVRGFGARRPDAGGRRWKRWRLAFCLDWLSLQSTDMATQVRVGLRYWKLIIKLCKDKFCSREI